MLARALVFLLARWRFFDDAKSWAIALTRATGCAVWFWCPHGWRRSVTSMPAPLQDVLPPMADLLVSTGFQVRSGRRADCPFCEGRSRGTVAFTNDVFFCHRCHRSGNAVSLARELGLFKGDRSTRALLRVEANRNRQLQAVAGRLLAMEHRTLMLARSNLLSLVALRRKAGWRLAELQAGAPEFFPGENEFCWTALKFAADHWARASGSYFLAAFGGERDRACFSLHPELRAQMVETVLIEGGLVKDRGGWQELVL